MSNGKGLANSNHKSTDVETQSNQKVYQVNNTVEIKTEKSDDTTVKQEPLDTEYYANVYDAQFEVFPHELSTSLLLEQLSENVHIAANIREKVKTEQTLTYFKQEQVEASLSVDCTRTLEFTATKNVKMDETSTSEKYIIQSQKPLCNAKVDTIQHMKDDDTDEITKSLCQLKDVSASGNTSVYHKDRKPIKRIISNELMRRNNFIPTDTNQENTTELSKEVFSTDTDCGKQIITFSNERTDRERVDKTELSDINLGTPHKTVFHCSECKYVTGKMPNLVKHSRMKHNAKIPHSCKVCNYKCNFKSVLQKHMRTHTGYKPYNCKHCDYKCADKSNFGRHLKYHNRGTDFQCSLCPLKFPRKYDLITHVRSHGNSQKPYACKHCDYKCSTASDLIFHARIHTGEKFYSCEDCDYKCLKSSDLKIHVTNHTTGNPYSCKLCDFKCSVPSALITHSMSHTDKKPYTCKQCNFRCSNSNALLTHAWSHTSEKPFCCKHCEYKCSRSSELINHARTHNADKLCDNDFNADLT